MRKYRFKLQAVLDHRETMENVRMQALAEAQAAVAARESRLIALRCEIQGLRNGRLAVPDAGDALRREAYLNVLETRLSQAVSDRDMAAARLEGARAELVAASQAKRALERTRERDRLTWRQEVERDEQSQLDEVAGQRYARNRAVNLEP